MNARNRVFLVLGALLVLSLGWYWITARQSPDLQLIGTVDANEVVVSARIAGQIQRLAVEEGQAVQAGQLVATIESQDLRAGRDAAAATLAANESKLAGSRDTLLQTRGEAESQAASAGAQLRAARASLAQAKAQCDRQAADTRRTVALAQQGIASAQARDEAVTSLAAAEAAVDTSKENEAAAAAALRQAQAHLTLIEATAKAVAQSRAEVANSRALLDQADVTLGYARVVAPVAGIVNVRAARQGEVVAAGAPIVTVMDLSQTWVYAPLPETQADAVRIGDSLRVTMPSGASLEGKVIAKAAEADFATQRDVSRRKRDIRTIQLKLLIPNPGMRYVPGMTAEVWIPKRKLVNP